jgi:hypothetical protein
MIPNNLQARKAVYAGFRHAIVKERQRCVGPAKTHECLGCFGGDFKAAPVWKSFTTSEGSSAAKKQILGGEKPGYAVTDS